MAWKAEVLVVANVTAGADELVEAMRRRAESGPAAFTLLVPATGGGSAGREAAERRLASGLERFRGEGLEVAGVVGDPDPVAAVQEAWDPASFDDIIVSTLPTHASRWMLVDLPHRLERMTGVPVRHVVVSEAKEPAHHRPAPERAPHGILGSLGLMWAGKAPPLEEPGAERGERSSTTRG